MLIWYTRDMNNNTYIDPFTSDAAAGERASEEEANVCISCEG